MFNINIICVGKLKEKYLKDAIDEYSKRLSKYCDLKIIEIQDEVIPDKVNDKIAREIKSKEAAKIISNIKKDAYVICLDLKGKEMTSVEFSEKIDNIKVNGYNNVTFIIGGSLGIGNEVIEICKEKICFSKMTFPHQLFRVFLLEQLFRGFKISNNEKYHL